jgi:hypothetical protein
MGFSCTHPIREVAVASSRKRKKELRKLRAQADAVLHNQREVLDHANLVVREAGRQAGTFAREEVAPRVRSTYESRFRPAIDGGLSVTRHAAHTARSAITDDVLPAVTAALGSSLAALEAAKNSDVSKAVSRAQKTAVGKAGKVVESAKKAGTKAVVKAHLVEPKKTSGPGKYILIGLAVVAVAGVAYAAWQTLRADDDLWIDDEIDQSDPELPVDE